MIEKYDIWKYEWIRMAVEWIEYKTVKEGKRKERKYNRKSDKYKLNENKKMHVQVNID